MYYSAKILYVVARVVLVSFLSLMLCMYACIHVAYIVCMHMRETEREREKW